MFQPVHHRLFRPRLAMQARRLKVYRRWLETLEDRLAPTVTLSISNPMPFPKPDTGQLMGMFVVTRAGDLGPVVLVDYHTQDGSGANGAHAGTDYVATSGTLDFASGQTMATIAVPILGNNIFQADKTFTISLLSPRSVPNGLSFAAQRTFAVGNQPYSVAVGDLTGDGKPDLVIANRGSGTVSVLLNTTPSGATTPSFAPQQTFAVVGDPQSVVVADFNGDGKPDIAVANNGPNVISVLLNTTPKGATTVSFAPQRTFAANGNPNSIAVGDFNGDGKLDLAVANGANGGGGSATVSVLLNTTPTGSTIPSFAPQQTFGTAATAEFIAVGDFNGDGKPDIAVANENSHSVSVLMNTTPRGASTASFASKQDLAVDNSHYSPCSLAVGDFTGDGKPDIATANLGSATMSVLLNTTPTGSAAASFASKQDSAAGHNPTGVAVADFTGDGKTDIVVTNGDFADVQMGGSDNTVSVLLNTTPAGATTASFAPQQTYSVGLHPRSVAVGDFNGDGLPDLAVANLGSGTVSVLMNESGGSINLSGSTATGTISSAPEAPTVVTGVIGSTPQSAIVNTAFAVPLAVDVRDAAGYLVQGVSVTFTAPGSGPSGKFGSSTSVTVVTNAAGRATAPALLTNTIAGSYSATAQAAGGSNPATNFSLTNTAGAPAVLMAMMGSNQSTIVNTSFATNLLATLTDQYGNRVPGVTVTFTAPASGAGATFQGGSTGTTDANGQVSKATAANTVAGTYSITATASGGNNPTATFGSLTNQPGAPAVLTAQAGYNQSVPVTTLFPVPLAATLTDQYGNPVRGVTVTFIAPSLGASATFAGGNTTTTDALGRVSKAITANIVAGSYSITAVASARTSPTAFFFNLTNLPDPPAGLAATIGSNQSTTVNTPFATSLWATVLDRYGNPVPGVLVAFTAPGNGASATFPSGNTATTNANGLAIVPITANTITGTYNITAAVSGGRNPGTTFINLTNTPAAADHFTVTTTAADPDIAGTPFDVTVTVQDVYGNAVPSYTGTVHFSSADPYGATLPDDYTFTAADQGIHTFGGGAAVYTAGTWDITTTDTSSGITGSASVNISAAPATAFQVIAPASAASGAPFDVTLIAVDPYDNTDVNYQGTVTWTTSDPDPGVMLPADYIFQPSDAGMVAFSGGVTLITQGDQTITGTATDSGINGIATVTVTPGPGPYRGKPGTDTLVGVASEQLTAPAPPAPPSAPAVLERVTTGQARREPVERNQAPETGPRADRLAAALQAQTVDHADLSLWDEVFTELERA